MKVWHVETVYDGSHTRTLDAIERDGGVVHTITSDSKGNLTIAWYEPEVLEYIEVEVEFSTGKDVESLSTRPVYEEVGAVSRTIATYALDGWSLVSKAYDKGYAYLTFSRPKPNVIYGGSEM